MIHLNVNNYCDEGCCNFEPKVEKKYYQENGCQKAITIVTCANAGMCENIRKYLDHKSEL